MNKTRLASLCGALVGLLVSACGDDTGTTGSGGGGTGGGTTTGTGGTTSTGGSGTGGGGTQFSAIVFGGPGGVTLEGAAVALDLDDGTRVEGTSNAMGEVSLTIPAGKAWTSVIGHKAGFNFVFIPKALNFQEPIQLGLAPDGSDKTGMVKLSGSATSMSSTTDDILSAIVRTSMGAEFAFEEKGVTDYELFIPSGDDFTLTFVDSSFSVTGQDFYRTIHSFVTSQETALTADTVLGVDFSTGIASSGSFTTSVAVPTDAALASNGFLIMNAFSDNGFTGGTTSCVHDGANAEFDCTGALYDNGATVNTTIYFATDQSDLTLAKRGANVVAVGGPPSGLSDPQWVNAPTVTAPSGAGPHAVDAPMTYTTASGGGAYDFTLYQLSEAVPGGRMIGFGFLPMGSFTVPDLPSASDAATTYATAMRAAIFNCRASQGQCVAVGFQEWDASPPN